MSIPGIYKEWFVVCKRFHPTERKTRLQNFAWLLTGIFLSRSVHLSKIANEIPGNAKKLSRERRLSRFLNNAAIRVRTWYGSIAQDLLLAACQKNQPIRLIVDGTKIGFGHQLLIVTLAFRRRAIPIAWTWVSSARGHSSSRKQVALLAYVRSLLPKGTRVLLVGDSEFGNINVIKQISQWKWHFALRQRAGYLLCRKGKRTWRRLGELITNPSEKIWLENIRLTQTHAFRVNLLAYWKVGEKEPWFLATNLTSPQAVLQAYRRRMWIEEMFGDLKKHGFDLESTHLQHFMRLSRLTLAAAILYVWLIAFGSKIVKNGFRSLVDRAERRDLSLFRIGMDMAHRYRVNATPIVITLMPYF